MLTVLILIKDDQFDPKSKYYDAKSSLSNPKWYAVKCHNKKIDIEYNKHLNRFISLKELQYYKLQISNMQLLTRSRLSVQKVTTEEFDFVINLSENTKNILLEDVELKQTRNTTKKQKINK